MRSNNARNDALSDEELINASLFDQDNDDRPKPSDCVFLGRSHRQDTPSMLKRNQKKGIYEKVFAMLFGTRR